MFTQETICREMQALADGPMTRESVRLMAELLYLQKHWKALPEAKAEDVRPLTREAAVEWVSSMENADGTKGPHWTMEKTEEALTQRGISCEPLAFWVAMNMMYSDYVKAAEKANCSSMDFYAYMAKAFLEDRDAQPEKLARYWRYVARH